jgi:hypothetical protein
MRVRFREQQPLKAQSVALWAGLNAYQTQEPRYDSREK